jgi:DNA-binding NarL/FixJ family response regulator
MGRRIRKQLRPLSRQPLGTALPSLPAGLTRSEASVLNLVTQGKNNRQIAEDLGLSEKTVANHLSHIFIKTDSENRAAATAFAIRHGLA